MIAARLSPGAISESSSSHLPASEGSKPPNPVMFPPGWLSRGTMLLLAFPTKCLMSFLKSGQTKIGVCHGVCHKIGF